MPDRFTTADLAVSLREPRWLAQKLAYCLREAGEISLCGKDGNSLCYQVSVPSSMWWRTASK